MIEVNLEIWICQNYWVEFKDWCYAGGQIKGS